MGAADQERISRVTATSPLDVTAGPPGIDGGRRTLESLIAIERKRHQHLAEQGNIYQRLNKLGIYSKKKIFFILFVILIF